MLACSLTDERCVRFTRIASDPGRYATLSTDILLLRDLLTFEEYYRNMSVITDTGLSPNDGEVCAEDAQDEVRSEDAEKVVVLRVDAQTHEKDSGQAVLGARAGKRLSAASLWVKGCFARARRFLRKNSHDQFLNIILHKSCLHS